MFFMGIGGPRKELSHLRYDAPVSGFVRSLTDNQTHVFKGSYMSAYSSSAYTQFVSKLFI